MYDNPFAVLTAVAAPAVLTNACSVLALGTSNRVARVVDRTRTIVNEIRARDRGAAPTAEERVQIQRLRRRSRLLLRALRIVYASLGGFAAAALISILGAISAYFEYSLCFRIAAVVALTTGFAAVGGLVAGCALMVAETRLALRTVDEALEGSLESRVI